MHSKHISQCVNRCAFRCVGGGVVGKCTKCSVIALVSNKMASKVLGGCL